jgi:hypothetical protein
VVVIIIAVVAGLAVWGDGAARAAAEDVVASELAERLPASAGPTKATIDKYLPVAARIELRRPSWTG